MKQILLLALLFIIVLVPNVEAQVTVPQVSQKAKVMQSIGFTDIYVVYHRPSVKEREVWGKLVPNDQVWRAGANENTVINFSGPVKIEGKDLAAGTYGLHMIPGEDTWTVIFSNNSSSWGSFSYNPSEDALKVNVKTKVAPMHFEQLTYTFEDVAAEKAYCTLNWEKLSVPFMIEVDVHSEVVADLRNQLRDRPGFNWMGWNGAARYCLNNNVNLQEAMNWVTRSVFMNPNSANMLTRAQLAAKLNGDESKSNEIITQTLESDLNAHTVSWREWHGAGNYLHTTLKDSEKGLAWMEKSVSMSPNMTNMLAKATILEATGKPDKAKKVKKDAVARGSNAELNTYGYQLLFSGQGQKATEVFKANTEKHPTDPNVWDSLGECYTNLGMKDDAVNALKKSLSLNPPAGIKANSIKLLKQLGVEYKSGT